MSIYRRTEGDRQARIYADERGTGSTDCPNGCGLVTTDHTEAGPQYLLWPREPGEPRTIEPETHQLRLL